MPPSILPEVNLSQTVHHLAYAVYAAGKGYAFYEQGICAAGKVIVLPFGPTAENLARF